MIEGDHPIDRYKAAFDTIAAEIDGQEAIVAAERRAAEDAVADLLALPATRRKLLVENSRRFRSLPLSLTLVQESHRMRFEDPPEALALAELACDVADRLDPDHCGSGGVQDTRARCWGQLGNARRFNSDLRGAEEAFSVARAHLQTGTGDVLEIARLLDLTATLRRAQGRLKDSAQLLEAAIRLFQEVGDHHMAGRSLIMMATVDNDQGHSESAIEHLSQGLTLIDLESEPELAVSASQNLALALSTAGQFEEALVALHRSGSLLEKISNHRTVRIRYRWLSGQIYAGMGLDDKAEAALLVARQGFIRIGLGWEFAQVSLDLAHLYAKKGRFADLKPLIAEMVPIFESRSLHADAMAALLLFRQAVETERATLGLVEEVRSYLAKSESDPKLRFRPSFSH